MSVVGRKKPTPPAAKLVAERRGFNRNSLKGYLGRSKGYLTTDRMGMRKGLRITSTGFSEPFEDNVEDHRDYETQSPVANKNKKNKSLRSEGNAYETSRELRIRENQKKLQELGIKNIVNSFTKKKKTVKQNNHAGDIDYIPDPGDDSEEDVQQVARNIAQHRSKYIPPMSMNRVANLRNLRRVVAPNVTQQDPSISNGTKPIQQQPTITMSGIIDGDKIGTKRRMVLVDEDDDEDNDISQGNIVDMEVDGVNQNDEYEDMVDRIHTNDQYELRMTDHNYSQEEDNVPEQLQGTEQEQAKGAPKKVRGCTQKAEIWRLNNTQRIIVTFNKFGQPVGDEGKELVQYLGTLVRMADHVSIEYSDWRKVPKKNKEDLYSLVKSKFTIDPEETSQIKKWILQNMGKKWRHWKGLLKSRGYDPSLTIDEIVTQQTNNDDRVNATQFKELVSRWFTPEFQSTCDAKRSCRSKMKEPHVTGSKSFARLAHEVALKNDGVYPTRGEMYITSRTRKDGSIVDDEAANVVVMCFYVFKCSSITCGFVILSCYARAINYTCLI
ncbi:hypothetical protein M8C21_015315 [Ambrosia artemisiifolia]|uniref:Uncharacterized protein n=1 Tax=Ambrosia artemisiifolia TaxID=4212 RepID=A0AAD5G3P7_AMBAR|nr:hypothetical protein M8C21_015315 [Ambrosia artemisiifolia]